MDALGLTQLATISALRDRAAFALNLEERALVVPARRGPMTLDTRLTGRVESGQRPTVLEDRRAEVLARRHLPGICDPVDNDLVMRDTVIDAILQKSRAHAPCW
jgi:hypothetical protein